MDVTQINMRRYSLLSVFVICYLLSANVQGKWTFSNLKSRLDTRYYMYAILTNVYTLQRLQYFQNHVYKNSTHGTENNLW